MQWILTNDSCLNCYNYTKIGNIVILHIFKLQVLMIVTFSLTLTDMLLPNSFEGDILLSPRQLEQYTRSRVSRAVSMVETAKWPGGIVPYELSPHLSTLLLDHAGMVNNMCALSVCVRACVCLFVYVLCVCMCVYTCWTGDVICCT